MSIKSVQVTTTVDIPLSIEIAAQWFSGLDDDSQARFFVEVAKLASEWPGPGHQEQQWYLVGSHLRNCKCSTDEARELIRTIAYGIEHGAHT